MIKFTIPLAPVTKKNSQTIAVNKATGRPFILPSKKYKEYEYKCGEYIPFDRATGDTTKPDTYPVNVKCLFYMPTRRSVDLTNLLEAIDDILTTYNVLPDDNSKYLGGHDGSRVLYDKDNPRTEVIIEPLDNLAEWQEYENTLYTGGGYTLCTSCGQRFSFGGYHEVCDFKYCPECGHKMTYKEGD